MNKEVVIAALEELSGFLEYSGHKEEIDGIIEELKGSDMSEMRRRKIKYRLSSKILFHPKGLGDVYVPKFPGYGIAWMNYLTKVASICQDNL